MTSSPGGFLERALLFSFVVHGLGMLSMALLLLPGMPGGGSAPDADAELRELPAAPAGGPWSAAFASWKDMLACVVPQDRVLSTQPWHGRVTRQEIRLDIPPASCRPLEGRVTSRAAAAWVRGARPFCFRVEKVRFRFDAEEYSPLA